MLPLGKKLDLPLACEVKNVFFFVMLLPRGKITDFLSKILIFGYENTEKLKYNLAALLMELDTNIYKILLFVKMFPLLLYLGMFNPLATGSSVQHGLLLTGRCR